MQIILYKKLKTVLSLLLVLSIFSCSKDEELGNLSDAFFVRHKKADMPAYIYGNGSEKVFLITLHGGPGGVGLDFRGNAFDKIEKVCATVYFDQRGSGMSQGSYSEKELSIDIMAEDVLALVKVIKHKYGDDSQFFLLGASWGGLLGTVALLKDQSDFLGWINVDGSHDIKGEYFEYIVNFERVAAEQIEIGNSIDFWQGVIDLIQDVDQNTFNLNDLRRLNKKAFEAEQQLNSDDVIFIPEDSGGGRLLLQYNPITTGWNNRKIATIFEDSGVLESLSFTNRLSEITIPSLVLWGRHDMVVPPAFAQEAYDNLGSSEKKLVFFEKSGHAPIGSEADKFADEVIQFIDQNK